uniref:tRNA pseudouridine(55) synthase n=1 Tax=Gouania willdenowi TaxID=441366 RepID=A0A8C5HLC3_GOUWI
MLPLKEKDKPIARKLLTAGCCARCVLRFCCVSTQASYRQPLQAPKYMETISRANNAAVIETHEDPPNKRPKLDRSVTLPQSEGDASTSANVVPISKGETSCVCPVCLGVLQELCGVIQAKKVCGTIKSEDYQFDTLVLSVSLPAQLCVREVIGSLLTFREKGLALDKDDVIQVKEAFKWVMQNLLLKELSGVAVVTKSTFEVGVEFNHPDTDADCHFLAAACPDCFKPTKNKQSVFTRMAVIKALEKIPDATFLRQYPCPPAQPTRCCYLPDIQCLHLSVFIAGRYNKFCRSLPQTPWLIDGERRMESSVEELIAEHVLSAFRAAGFNFSSSGREDVDVRTLGTGRPFAMELLNPHRSRFSRAEMKQLQETINKSSEKIRVRDLQIVSREAMSRMKEGEEDKSKSYTALVWTHKSIQEEDLAFIHNIKDLVVDQKTPLRVLHRRALAVRPRVIHSMSTRFLDSHHFYLELKTQAGTYIKEFVHGDFGRTKPNMCQLLNSDTDILELDVEVRKMCIVFFGSI